MHKHTFKPVDGVSNIELFYDLIFVYCISVMTSLCHHVEGGFLDLATWLIFTFAYLAVLQVWFFTTLFMNRFGERSASDNLCLFVNMFLLYYMASGIQQDWASSARTFNLSWALILVNMAVHWELKRHVYDNLDAADLRMIRVTVVTLLAQAAIACAAAFLPFMPGVYASWAAVLLGGTVWGWSGTYKAKSARFSHVAERCSLLTIIAFGEMVVSLTSYVSDSSNMIYPVLVFVLVVGLFLIYIFEHDNMLDHHHATDGMTYMTITSWLIICLGNITVALEYMTMPEVDLLPKSLYRSCFLVLYLLTSFALAHYNKPAFAISPTYRAGRVGACVALVVGGVASGFDPLASLVIDVAVVYFALWHEWHLYHSRIGLMAFGCSLGLSHDDMPVGHDLPVAQEDVARRK